MIVEQKSVLKLMAERTRASKLTSYRSLVRELGLSPEAASRKTPLPRLVAGGLKTRSRAASSCPPTPRFSTTACGGDIRLASG